MKKILIILLTVLMFIPNNINALTMEKDVHIYLFYGRECPHCKEEKEFLDEYMKDKPYIKLHLYEVWHSNKNAKLFKEIQDVLDIKATGVPYTVIANKVIIGYSSYTEKTLTDNIKYAYENEFKDLTGIHLGLLEDNTEDDDTQNKNNGNNEVSTSKNESNSDEENFYNIPILGEIDAKSVSLPFIAMIIGLVDGLNPCAMWILIFLITMLIGMKDRKRMWILGLTFLISSAIVYLLFMISWLNLAVFVNKVVYIRVAIGAFAFLFGMWNIYSFIKSKNEDVGCEVVNDNKRKNIISSIKKITTNKYFILSFLGIIALAFTVNVVELLCSLGLPVLFTQILSLNSLNFIEYAIYMFIYILFFLIDDLIVFIIAMRTLQIKGLSNKISRYSHLIGGTIMFIIGILMIFKPEWLMFNF